jgi:hypothetical protein
MLFNRLILCHFCHLVGDEIIDDGAEVKEALPR